MNAKRRQTIFDLEKATGFSRGTISRAFNKRPEVSARTMEIILKKAAEIGYKPHSGARSMTMGTTGRWGLLIPHLQNPFYGEIMEAMDREARLRDTLMLVGLSHNDKAVEKELINHWASGETDGIAIISHTAEVDAEMIKRLNSSVFPIVFLYARPSLEFDYVACDVEDCFDRMVRHLLELGHTQIAYLGQKSGYSHTTATYRAYDRNYVQKRENFDPRLIYLGAHPSEMVALAWKQWRQMPEPPTAVMCFNDLIACWLIHAVKGEGLSIPGDLSVVGNDDTAEAARTRLTTVRVNPATIAREIFGILDHPRAEDEPSRERMITGDLIMRDSTGMPRKHPLPRR